MNCEPSMPIADNPNSPPVTYMIGPLRYAVYINAIATEPASIEWGSTVAVSGTDTGLAKVVVAAPKRRLELALPEQLPTAALLPGLLRQAGEDAAGEGPATGGWLLRRADGTVLDGARTLA